MALTLEEKMERIIEQYDPDLVVDILNLTTRQLLEAFTEEFLEKYSCFDDYFVDGDAQDDE